VISRFQNVPFKCNLRHYTLDTFPKNLKGRQICAKDVWAEVSVSRGRLRWTALAVPGEGDLSKEKDLTYMNGGAVVPPQFPFEIAPVPGEKRLKFRIVYYKAPPPAPAPPLDGNGMTVAPADRLDGAGGGGGGGGGEERRGPTKYSFKWGGKKKI
jgi:tellurite resistance-related uncharacterized protein